jgi:hypothetical protein
MDFLSLEDKKMCQASETGLVQDKNQYVHCLGGLRKRGRRERGEGGKGVRAKDGKRKESGVE